MLGLRFGLTTAHGSGTLVPHDATVVQVDAEAAQHGCCNRSRSPSRPIRGSCWRL